MRKLGAIILVNLLTLIRIIGVFLLYPIYHRYGGVAAASLCVFCYFTDFLDGLIARRAHVSTFLGSIMDGTADKLFTVANLILLLTITKLAIIPILFELAIVAIQGFKFKKNINVQSSYMGKLKTWVISITVIALYLITDINNVHILPDNIISYIANNELLIMNLVLIPLYIFEVLTLISYLKFLKTYDPKEKIVAPKINVKLKKPTSFKDKWDNFVSIYLNNEIYEKYKDSAGIKDILKQIKYKD